VATVKAEIGFFFPDFNIEQWFKNEESFFRNNQVNFDNKLMQHIVKSK
jgi:hypothetical protein